MSSAEPLLWRLLPDVRVGERSRFLFFAGLFMLISLGQTVGLAGAEALFLAELGVEDLAQAFVAAASFTVLGSMAYAARVGSERNDALFIQMLLGAAVLLAGGAFLVGRQSVWVLPVLFCFWYMTQAIFLNHFWTFSGDFFDTLSSKRLVPIFTIGASLGGMAGGLTAAGLAHFSGPASLIAAWGVTLAAAAALLVFGRRALRRWGPLELEEADETSVESLRGAARYAGRSPLARWLVLSALGMVIAAFLAQYLYSGVFAQRFPEPAELAAFFALYFAVTNGIEILVEVLVTPRLIRRIGVPGANLIHPVLLLLSFGGLAWRYTLPAAMGARVARELMDNALAAPVRSLVQNAIPRRLRGRMRAFLEGIVVYAGMAAAGLLLIVIGEPDPLWLCGAGAAAALFYLFANIRARHTYCDTLVEQLKTGRLDFTEGEAAIGAWEASRLAELWEESLRTDGPRPSASVMQLIPVLASRGIVDPLVRSASHSTAAVRRASVTALASTGREDLAGPLALSMDDSDPEVRRAALRGLAHVSRDGSFLRSRVDDLLEDRDPRVRAEAASMAGEAGVEILERMIGSSNAAEAGAALAIAPAALLSDAIERTGSDDARIRAAALECTARLADAPPLDTRVLRSLLGDDDDDVRRAAALLAARYDTEDVLAALSDRLADPSTEVRAAVESVLSSLGAAGMAAVEPSLRDDREQTVEAALRVVAANDAPGSRSLLLRELRHRVAQLWWYVLGFQHLGADRNPSHRPLAAAFGDAILREWRLAFRVLGLLESENVVRKVLRELRAGSARSRADALEVLANLGDRETAGLLVLAHEAGPLQERARFVAGRVDVPTQPGTLVEQALEADNRWVRHAARLAADAMSGLPLEEEKMQQLLALKQVDLFTNLSFEQLEALLQASGDAEYLAGEVIFREGEPGDKLFLLVEGTVEVVKDHGGDAELKLQTLQAVNYFGEMAILAEDPRSATIITATSCRLITLDGAAFRELLLHIPEISFEIFRVLTRRVRDSERKLQER